MNTPPTGPSIPQQPNPANDPTVEGEARIHRVPMTTATRTMEVDDIPGYHLHWFRDSRVARAKAAGYELVSPEEVRINNHSIGASNSLGGNTDLGSNVSVIGSVEGPNGQSERAVLMKIREEWWQEDSAALAERNMRIMRDIFGGERIADPSGAGLVARDPHTYVKEDRTSLDKGMKGAPLPPQKPILNRGMPKARTGGRFNI